VGEEEKWLQNSYTSDFTESGDFVENGEKIGGQF
jgi:hypothetical protein